MRPLPRCASLRRVGVPPAGITTEGRRVVWEKLTLAPSTVGTFVSLTGAPWHSRPELGNLIHTLEREGHLLHGAVPARRPAVSTNWATKTADFVSSRRCPTSRYGSPFDVSALCSRCAPVALMGHIRLFIDEGALLYAARTPQVFGRCYSAEGPAVVGQ